MLSYYVRANKIYAVIVFHDSRERRRGMYTRATECRISGGTTHFGVRDTRVKLVLGYGIRGEKFSGIRVTLRISWDTGYLVGMIVFNEREIALHACVLEYVGIQYIIGIQ